MRVKKIMREVVVTVSPEDTLHKVLEVFSSKKISGAPVVKNGKLIGLITEYDIIKALDIYTPRINFSNMPQFLLVMSSLKGKKMDELEKEIRITAKLKVKDCMTTDLITIGKGDTVIKAARLINKNKINRLPVVEKGKVIGILTRKDIIKALAILDGKIFKK